MSGRSWRGLGIAMIVLVIVGLVVFGARTLFEPFDSEIRLPPKGKALFNPLYGLERSLIRRGTPTQSHARLDMTQLALRPGDGLVLVADPQQLPKVQADALLAWVRGGGHLVIGMSDELNDDPGPIFSVLSITQFDEDWRCERLQHGRKKNAVQLLCGGQRFEWSEGTPRLSWGDSDHGFVFARFAQGQGSIDVLSELDFLSNREIERDVNWQLAYQVLAPALNGRMSLIYEVEAPTVWDVLLDRGWAILAGAGLALLAWLLMRSQRFGPLLPVEPVARRALLEHVQAAGEHAWRRGAARELHAALRDAFLARLRRRDPMALALQGELRIDYLAKKLAVDPARIRTALIPPPIFHAESFREAIASLIQLGLRL